MIVRLALEKARLHTTHDAKATLVTTSPQPQGAPALRQSFSPSFFELTEKWEMEVPDVLQRHPSWKTAGIAPFTFRF